MTLWLDAQLPPSLAAWVGLSFGVECCPLKLLGLRDAEDLSIFQAARDADVVVMTKDRDFGDLLKRLGPPPRVIWLTCGNTSNTRLQEILATTLPEALALLKQGEDLVEIGDVPPIANGTEKRSG